MFTMFYINDIDAYFISGLAYLSIQWFVGRSKFLFIAKREKHTNTFECVGIQFSYIGHAKNHYHINGQ